VYRYLSILVNFLKYILGHGVFIGKKTLRAKYELHRVVLLERRLRLTRVLYGN
jgi:hypothetical protein